MGELMYTFMKWFEGDWNNQKQAYSNPRSAPFVHVKHERISNNSFRCSYRYHRKKKPYRDFTVEVINNDGEIILKNPRMDIIFKLESGVFVTSSRQTVDGIEYINEAYLGNKHYSVWDEGRDIKTGELKWGLNDGGFFEFLLVE